MHNDFVCGGAFEMRRGADMQRGIAHAEDNQIRGALFGNRKNPLCRVSIFHERLGRKVQLRVLQERSHRVDEFLPFIVIARFIIQLL